MLRHRELSSAAALRGYLIRCLYRARGLLNPHNLGVPLCFARLSIVALDDADARAAAAAGVTSPAMLRCGTHWNLDLMPYLPG